MKTAISMPDELFERSEAEAQKLGLSRSKLIQIALEQYFAARREAELIERINRTIEKYGDPSGDEEAWLDQGRRVVAHAAWDE